MSLLSDMYFFGKRVVVFEKCGVWVGVCINWDGWRSFVYVGGSVGVEGDVVKVMNIGFVVVFMRKDCVLM